MPNARPISREAAGGCMGWVALIYEIAHGWVRVDAGWKGPIRRECGDAVSEKANASPANNRPRCVEDGAGRLDLAGGVRACARGIGHGRGSCLRALHEWGSWRQPDVRLRKAGLRCRVHGHGRAHPGRPDFGHDAMRVWRNSGDAELCAARPLGAHWSQCSALQRRNLRDRHLQGEGSAPRRPGDPWRRQHPWHVV